MPFDAFLKLGDGSRVKGGADDAAHKGEIELLSFGLKAAKAGGPGGPSASFSAFTLRKRADRATPLLVQACASGEQFDSARVTVRKPAGS